MSAFNVFALLARGGNRLAIHNVRLVDVQAVQGEHEGRLSRLIVEYSGETAELVGAGKPDEYMRKTIGAFGYVVPMTRASDDSWTLPLEACYFRPYLEPSLRRVPELDYAERSDGHASAQWGWRCDDRPGCFFAPAGLIPGEGGAFIADETIEVTLRVPPEFVRECRRVQRSPAELLRGFIADAAGVSNDMRRPRADGFSSNGSDEREYATAWIDRAYGMWAIDVDAAEGADYAREERQAELDDFGMLLGEYVDEGGKAETLVALVEAAVAKQRQAN